MAIELNPEQERIIGEAIHAGIIRNHDDILTVGIRALEERLESHPATAPRAPEEWLQDLHEWVESHTVSTPILPGQTLRRDSIFDSDRN